jgi:hypothetical protein
MLPGRVSSSCSKCDIRRLTLVSNLVIRHSWIRKESDCDYEIRNISVFTCDTYIPWRLTRWWWRSQNFRRDDYNLTTGNHWLSCFLVSFNSLSMKSRLEEQAMEYRNNWEMYTPYTGAVRILLHNNGKFTSFKSRQTENKLYTDKQWS